MTSVKLFRRRCGQKYAVAVHALRNARAVNRRGGKETLPILFPLVAGLHTHQSAWPKVSGVNRLGQKESNQELTNASGGKITSQNETYPGLVYYILCSPYCVIFTFRPKFYSYLFGIFFTTLIFWAAPLTTYIVGVIMQANVSFVENAPVVVCLIQVPSPKIAIVCDSTGPAAVLP